jgi:hypothetical protein
VRREISSEVISNPRIKGATGQGAGGVGGAGRAGRRC